MYDGLLGFEYDLYFYIVFRGESFGDVLVKGFLFYCFCILWVRSLVFFVFFVVCVVVDN